MEDMNDDIAKIHEYPARRIDPFNPPNISSKILGAFAHLGCDCLYLGIRVAVANNEIVGDQGYFFQISYNFV